MLYETLRGIEPLRKLYHTAIYRNACDVIHAPAAETVLRLLLLAAFAALFYLLCRQTQNRFRSVWITAVVCVLSTAVFAGCGRLCFCDSAAALYLRRVCGPAGVLLLHDDCKAGQQAPAFDSAYAARPAGWERRAAVLLYL